MAGVGLGRGGGSVTTERVCARDAPKVAAMMVSMGSGAVGVARNSEPEKITPRQQSEVIHDKNRPMTPIRIFFDERERMVYPLVIFSGFVFVYNVANGAAGVTGQGEPVGLQVVEVGVGAREIERVIDFGA